jgi:hypothetical protein
MEERLERGKRGKSKKARSGEIDGHIRTGGGAEGETGERSE